MRGFNDDELVDLLEFGREIGAEVRFIEYMDVGGATHWSLGEVVSQQEMLAKLEAHYGPIEREAGGGALRPQSAFACATARAWASSRRSPSRSAGPAIAAALTADGLWYTCLYAQQGTDLKPLLRNGADRERLVRRISAGWAGRTDRSAEERRDDPHRGVLYQVSELQADPHREMHTRGG